MSILNINKCTFRIVDGRKATLQIGTVNAAVLYTLVSKHHGTRQDVKVAHVTSGLTTPLSVAVAQVNDLYTITVNLQTDGAGVAISTAAQVRTAVNASVDAAALVLASLPGTGASVAVAAAAAAVNDTPARYVEFKVADGTLQFGESKEIIYTPNKGVLDDVKTGDEQPLSIDTSFTWEDFEASVGSGTPSPLDILFQNGEAATYTSTADASGCPPYCVDIEVEINPGCSEVREFVTFEEFLWDDIAPTFKDGKIAFKGQCNRTQPKFYRIV